MNELFTPYKMANGQTCTLIGVWSETQSWGAVWTMRLERITSVSGKTSSFLIYANGGQSYPVGTFKTLKAALKMLASFSNYKQTAGEIRFSRRGYGKGVMYTWAEVKYNGQWLSLGDPWPGVKWNQIELEKAALEAITCATTCPTCKA